MSLQNNTENGTLDPKLRALFLAARQATIIILGALEDALDMDRSIVPRHKRIGWSPDAPGRAQAHAISETVPALDDKR